MALIKMRLEVLNNTVDNVIELSFILDDTFKVKWKRFIKTLLI